MFNWAAFMAYDLVASFTPGPNNISSMSNGSTLGFKRSLPFNLGVWCGLTTAALLCAAFCSLLSGLIPKIKLPMMILGAIYILYLAYKILKRSPEIEGKEGNASFFSGLVLQFVNAKLYICYIVCMESYILPYYSGRYFILLGFALLISTVSFIATLCWSAFGSVFRTLFFKYSKTIKIVMALLLVYCAVALFI